MYSFPVIFLRSLLFNILFYGTTAIACIVLIPFLLAPRKVILLITKTYLACTQFLMRYVLGITYEVRGKKYLPKKGSYLLAAKHQSAYETLKLHALFGDPTIVLKEELIKIPLFGQFLNKLDVIPINRRNKEEAINSIVNGARRMSEADRPIVIFPQGTRVNVSATTKEKPYKGGIVKMYGQTGLPIIPMALNTGLFWGRNGFIKKPGHIIFEFLPPIEAGLPDKKVMKALEDRLEQKSNLLAQESINKYPHLTQLQLTYDSKEPEKEA